MKGKKSQEYGYNQDEPIHGRLTMNTVPNLENFTTEHNLDFSFVGD
jgi:hypothetical protein